MNFCIELHIQEGRSCFFSPQFILDENLCRKKKKMSRSYPSIIVDLEGRLKKGKDVGIVCLRLIMRSNDLTLETIALSFSGDSSDSPF